MVRDLHKDLVRKYKRHGDAICRHWRSFGAAQRTSCMRAGAVNGELLKHSLDASMGNVCKFIPEWNLRDITKPGSDALLDLFDHRTSKDLCEQYCFEIWQSFDIAPAHRDEVFAGLASAVNAGLLVPYEIGQLVLNRQLYLLQALNIMIEDILEEGSKTRNTTSPPKPQDPTTLADAVSHLTVGSKPAKISLPDLVATAADQRDALQDYLGLLSTHPVVFCSDVNATFFSRPEVVPDEKGRMLPALTDKHISPAVFDSVHNAVRSAAIWNYLSRLLELLEANPDKVLRPIILQELANVCNLEYSRAQAAFKRQVQTGTGAKWFKRLYNVNDKAGNALVTMKGNSDELASSDPQLHYMLRLCHPDTTAQKAVSWIKKLGDLHESRPEERDKLHEREVQAVFDLAIIIGFIHDLSPAVSMPGLSRKKCQHFVSRTKDLEAELNELKKDIDLLDYASPIDNLLEPGMAQSALDALDQFVIERAGTKMGFLYEDLIQDCLADLQKQHQQAKAKLEKVEYAAPPVLYIPEKREERVEQRKEKEKTRPSHSSVYEIAPQSTRPKEPDNLPTMSFNVTSTAARVFSTLFSKALARGSVSWASFGAAMAELGFSVVPKFGSVYTFIPPSTLAVQKPLTLHRPHKSHIEGHLIPIFAQRLKRTYGWGEESFVVS
ncbi:hypothetical protein B0T16DRAFT_435514 [Cercophora newfieldiana]|uniref:Ipa protein n=1 Tax=Cercophora newfieldiana TaxID=92897 RepID=A0AA40CXQ4_9PEZI|nr:hypothetical protein B0T16DRAFT_435514 [Cercophora newfieldiana]